MGWPQRRQSWARVEAGPGAGSLEPAEVSFPPSFRAARHRREATSVSLYHLFPVSLLLSAPSPPPLRGSLPWGTLPKDPFQAPQPRSGRSDPRVADEETQWHITNGRPAFIQPRLGSCPVSRFPRPVLRATTTPVSPRAGLGFTRLTWSRRKASEEGREQPPRRPGSPAQVRVQGSGSDHGGQSAAAAPSGRGHLLLQVGRSGCQSRVGVGETATAITCRNLKGGEINSGEKILPGSTRMAPGARGLASSQRVNSECAPAGPRAAR